MSPGKATKLRCRKDFEVKKLSEKVSRVWATAGAEVLSSQLDGELMMHGGKGDFY